jgi:protein N-terminal methyltransferase
VTQGLLLDGIAKQVDVIEPIAKFTAAMQGKPGVGSIFNVGLEDWQPTEGAQYDLIWIQWCVVHLTDEQLVEFLKRCKSALNPDGGLIVVKENNSTGGKDEFDDIDSSVTRYVSSWLFLCCSPVTNTRPYREDGTFRRIFTEAGLRLVRVELQRGLEVRGMPALLPVRMYALRPAQ